MAGCWPSVILAGGLLLAGCRTPTKTVSVFPIDGEDSVAGSHFRDHSDIGATVTGRMQLPDFGESESGATNSTAGNLPVTNVAPAMTADELPAKAVRVTDSQAERESLHLKVPGAEPLATHSNMAMRINIPVSPVTSKAGSESLHMTLPGAEPGMMRSNVTAQFKIPGAPTTGMIPTSQPIHLSLPAWTNAAGRASVSLAGQIRGNPPVATSQPVVTNLPVPVSPVGILPVALAPARPVTPEVGDAPLNTPDTLSKSIDLQSLWVGVHDADWREQQAARQRAAEKARQTERDNLDNTLQQLLQRDSK